MSIVARLMVVLVLALCGSFVPFHPIHIAISEVSYSEKDKALQVMHKIFYDDLENHIEQLEKAAGREVNLRLGSDKEHAQADEYIRKYVENHFKLTADGKTYAGTYLGKEFETDAVWIYIEVEKVKVPKKLDVSDTILMDLHSDQSNFVHFNIASQKKSLRFQKGSERQQVSF
ncbi:MAG: DUF6702 family protein [Saprospiraceae bacterium]